jgi:signal peptidase II
MGGGIDNIINRIVFDSAVVFLHINFRRFQTGIIDMADVSNMTGTSIILLASYSIERKIEGAGKTPK